MTDTNQITSFLDAAIAMTVVFVSIVIVISVAWLFKHYCCRTSTNSSESVDMLRISIDRMYDLSIGSLSSPNSGNTGNSSDRPVVPFSTKVRGMFLESILQHETFHPKTASHQSDDVEKGIHRNTKKLPCTNDGTDDVEYDADISSKRSTDDTVDEDNLVFDIDIALNDEEDRNETDCEKCTITESRSLDESIRSGRSNTDVDNSESYCAICFDAFTDGDDVTTSNCLKTFHRTCIIQWLMQHDTCPYCRNTFKNVKDDTCAQSLVNNKNDFTGTFDAALDINLNRIIDCE